MGEKRSKIGDLAGAAFADPEEMEKFRAMFNDMRAAMAAHHSTWPLVSIDLSNPEYRASIQQSRDATHRFINWAKKALTTA